jgi:DMSO/TMAO reductase YedYZ molybdopterin-dependent catalytic subunit
MRYPWANSLLFLFLGLELLTGFLGLISGSEDRSIYLQLHRIGGYGIVAVLVWKTVNVAMSLKWRRSGPVRTGSLVLTGLLLATLVLGFVWSWTGPYSWWLFSGVSWHIYAGVALVPLLVWHWRHMRRPARKGFSVERRQFLRIAGLAVAGFVAWQASEGLLRAADFSGKSRRFTGSYEAGSFTGNDFPRVSWLNDHPDRIDVETWTVTVQGSAATRMVLTHADLAEDARVTATLDCTGGWHSTQEWSGAPLADILDSAAPAESARSVVVRSVTGYSRRFSLSDARGFLLATGVGGEPLSHGHGAPVRLVAPGRRGFEWVKWVAEIEISDAPGWWQLPLPAE